MARLRGCMGCGATVADAAMCEKCGRPLPARKSGGGRIFGGIVVGGLVVTIGGCMASIHFAESQAKTEQAASAKRITELNEARVQTLKVECEASKPATLVAYRAAIDRGDHDGAANTVSRCADAGDADLKKLEVEAFIGRQLAVASDRKAKAEHRVHAIQTLLRDHPQSATAVAAELPALQARVERDNAAEAAVAQRAEAAAARAEKARRRSEGVTLGMSEAEVIQSNWGKPRKVNRTTYTFGVREQWVYDGGYLYFKDGVLDSIQN